MTLVNCSACGAKLLKRQAVVSKRTGAAWCLNERACEKRREAALTRTEAKA